MYFINDKHKVNYRQLVAFYKGKVDFLPSIYIAAVPEIYEVIDTNGLSQSTFPFSNIKSDGLSDKSWSLCEVATSLYMSDYNVSLSKVFASITDDTYLNAIFEAIKMGTRLNE
ncbi:DUF2538 family protein [Salirhabdus salicampi]|uniref:DUF2538 family protein n=1 Tax=Salirhabdus salicampi TaxID=476102 RepID=UPI0020C595EB|nr:DUF2538 family protein [Salirhabdus salicampi]MCP8616305.1 DUF2538 family protein [Salirhabdus salicampi]